MASNCGTLQGNTGKQGTGMAGGQRERGRVLVGTGEMKRTCMSIMHKSGHTSEQCYAVSCS